jgi:hypothetical protein
VLDPARLGQLLVQETALARTSPGLGRYPGQPRCGDNDRAKGRIIAPDSFPTRR